MMPGSAALAACALVRAVDETVAALHLEEEKGPSRLRRLATSRVTAWIVALLISAAAIGGSVLRVSGEEDRIESLQAALATARSDLSAAAARGQDAEALRAQIADLRQRLAELREAKVRTVVEEKTITETKIVTEWVPNGEGVTVEITGFEGLVELRDVQLTHAYGFSDLIGVAVNTSGETISYAQLGCTFLDAEGAVVANEIDNKQNWLPDQTWGFSCSGQVRATGGILRVDELT